MARTSEAAVQRRWGWYAWLEPRVRALVSAELGVGMQDLASDVSLADDLAVDSLDLLSLAFALESAFGIAISERTLAAVRRYGDLVDVIVDLVAHSGESWPQSGELVCLHVRLRAQGGPLLERSEWLTPYGIETIAGDAARAGPRAELDVVAPPGTPPPDLRRLEEALQPLTSRGLRVSIRIEAGAAFDSGTPPVHSPEEDPDGTVDHDMRSARRRRAVC